MNGRPYEIRQLAYWLAPVLLAVGLALGFNGAAWAGGLAEAGLDPPLIYAPFDDEGPSVQDEHELDAAPSVEWQYHKTGDSNHPDGNEQQLMWLMNRARSDPQQEGVWLATSTDPDIADGRDYYEVNTSVLKSEFASYFAKPPAAFDSRLYEAAAEHNEYMKVYGGNTHDGQFDRVNASGFSYTQMRGNVFAYADSALNAHAAFNIDWGSSGDNGMQTNRGHRKAIMSLDGDYTNVGLAQLAYSGNNVGPNLVTGNYANASGSNNCFNRFIVGTVWKDADGDGMFDPGEGKAGVKVMPDKGTYFAYTSDGGGYAIPISSAGDYTLTFSGGQLTGTVTKSVTVGAGSVLCDVTGDGSDPKPDPDPDPKPEPQPDSDIFNLPSVDASNAVRSSYQLAYNYQRDQFLVAWLEKKSPKGEGDTHINLASFNRDGQVVAHGHLTVPSASGAVPNLGMGSFRDAILLVWPQQKPGSNPATHTVRGMLINWPGLEQLGSPFTINDAALQASTCLASYNTYTQEFLVAWQAETGGSSQAGATVHSSDYVGILGAFISNFESGDPEVSLTGTIGMDANMKRKPTGMAHNVATGDWLIVYEGWQGSESGVYAARVSHDHTVTKDIVINNYFGNYNPKVTAFNQGNEYLVTWTNEVAGYFNVNARVLDKDGNQRGGLKGVSASVDASRYPSIAGWTRCSSSDAYIVWNEANTSGGSMYNIKARRLMGDVNGDFDGGSDGYTLVQGKSTAQPWTPAVAAGERDWFVVWLSSSEENPGYAQLKGTFIRQDGGCILNQ